MEKAHGIIPTNLGIQHLQFRFQIAMPQQLTGEPCGYLILYGKYWVNIPYIDPMELAMFTLIIVVTSSWFLFYVLEINRNSQIQIPTLLHAAKLSHPTRVAQDVQWWPPKKDIYMYTWNPNDPCFDWKRPCVGGLTFKNRGHLGSRYIKICTHTCMMSHISGVMIHNSPSCILQ